MRVFSLAVILSCCAVTGAAELKSDRQSDRPQTENRYVIECRLVSAADDGKRTVLMAPTISVSEGVPANVKDVTQTPFVTGVVSRGGRDEARITVLEEGTTIELTVLGEGNDRVTVDATIKTAQITGAEMKAIGRGDHCQCPRTESRTARVIESVALGEEVEVEAKVPEGAPQRTIEFVVRTPAMPQHWKTTAKLSNDGVRDAAAPQGRRKNPVPYQHSSAANQD